MRLAEEDSAPTDTDVSTKNRRCCQAYPRGKVIVHPGHRKAEYIEEGWADILGVMLPSAKN
jgi:hypothetical protein